MDSSFDVITASRRRPGSNGQNWLLAGEPATIQKSGKCLVQARTAPEVEVFCLGISA